MKNWNSWEEDIHLEKKQVSKQKKAVTSECKPIKIDNDTCSGLFSSTNVDMFYNTTLVNCSCMNYARERYPCKHMYRLSYELGIVIPPSPLKDGFKKQEALKLFEGVDGKASHLFKEISDKGINQSFLIEDSPEIQELIVIGFVDLNKNHDDKLSLLLDKLTKNELIALCDEIGNRPSKGEKKVAFIDFALKNKNLLLIESYDHILCVYLSKNIDGLVNSIIHAHHKRYPAIQDNWFSGL